MATYADGDGVRTVGVRYQWFWTFMVVLLNRS